MPSGGRDQLKMVDTCNTVARRASGAREKGAVGSGAEDHASTNAGSRTGITAGARALRSLELPNPETVLIARRYLASRRRRSQILTTDLFADPAWDMLIDLFAAWGEGRRVSVSSVCAASGVPRSTALRWVPDMERQGLVKRWPDPRDARRIFVEITREAAVGVEEWLNATFAK
jgi:hypothetical protein